MNIPARPRRRSRAIRSVVCLVVVLAGVAASCSPASRPGKPAVDGANSADRILFWTSVKQVVAMTDADLKRWKDLGVDGFTAQIQWVEGMGGESSFTADPKADLSGDKYALQRAIRDSRIVERAKRLGMKLYLGFYMANLLNTRTPLQEWFDDAGWREIALPRIAQLSGAAKMLGFDGLAVDQELYPQAGNVLGASWSPTYPGNTHTIDETRAEATLRGRQLMTAILNAWPGVELQAYGTKLPDGWEELVQGRSNDVAGFDGLLYVPFWDGLTSIDGYKAIRFVDAIFYKDPQVRGATWDTANQYNANRLYAMLSRRLSNWSYASSRIFVSPFSWVDAGPSSFERARSPENVAEQLAAFRKWGTGREFANFTYDLADFDYRRYAAGIRAASTPARVDSEPPAVTVTSVTRNGSTIDVSGTATDNLGIQAVRWSPDGGGDGLAAQMTWQVRSGDYSSAWDWQMDWTLTGIPADAAGSTLTIRAEDIKGLTTATKVPAPAE